MLRAPIVTLLHDFTVKQGNIWADNTSVLEADKLTVPNPASKFHLS